MPTAIITGQNQWTDELVIDSRAFDLSITGLFVATVTVQRRRKDEPTKWRDVKSYTQAELPIEQVSAIIVNQWVYRAGVKTGDYISGTIEVGIFSDK